MGRARASDLYPEILVDEQAIEIVKTRTTDFTSIADGFRAFGGMSYLVRARAMDDAIKKLYKTARTSGRFGYWPRA